MKKNLIEINMIRAIACIFVVVTHAITNYLNNIEVDIMGEDRFIVWIRFAILCATPIFILLSETLLAKNYPTKLPSGFFLKRLRYIVVPYFLIGMIVSYRDSEKNINSFLNVLIEKVLLGHWYGFFVIVIIQFYVLHWLIGRYLARINPVIPLLISFAISFSHIYMFVNVTEYKNIILSYYPFSYRTHIFIWLFYFIVAFYIGRYYEEIVQFLINRIWMPIVTVFGSYTFIMYNVLSSKYTIVASERYDMLFYAINVFFLMIVAIRKYNLQSKWLINISYFSYFIYLSHMITLPYYAELSLGFSRNFFIYVCIMTFLTIATSIGWALLFSNSRLTKLFTGRIKYFDEVSR